MVSPLARQIRALLALALFGTSDGGAQLLDAVVFHSHPPAHADVPRINDGDHCHAEKCDLGAPIASPPPVAAPIALVRLELIAFLVSIAIPTDAPRSALASSPLGSRAPPLRS